MHNHGWRQDPDYSNPDENLVDKNIYIYKYVLRYTRTIDE